MDAISRRSLIQQTFLAGAGLAIFPGLTWPASWQQTGRELIPFDDIPENFSTRRAGEMKFPGQEVTGQDLRELKDWITPEADIFAVQHYNIPELDASAWRLTVDGLVSKRLTLTLDDVKRRPRTQKTVTFECSGNQQRVLHRMVANATYTGCSLKALLEEAGPARDAIEAVFWCADEGEETIRGNKYQMKFARSMSLTDALGSDAMLTYELNGKPLPVVHGFPVRLIVPGWYGISNVKWLQRIELSPARLMNRFMGRDYVTVMGRQVGDHVEYTETSVTRQRIKSVVARVTRPAGGAGGALSVFGVAWSDGTPIQQVEVQVDDGPWRLARLEAREGQNPFAWTFWTLAIDPLPAGAHTIASRATDRAGRSQPADLSLKKTYWEDNAIFPRKIRV